MKCLQEVQIRAKSVLERDLALIRATRAERERDAQALEAKKSAKELEDRLGRKSGDLACPAFRLGETENAEAEDAIMLDQTANQGSKPYDSSNSKDFPSAQGPENPALVSEDLPRQAGGSKVLVMSIDTGPQGKAPFSPTAIKRQNTTDTTDQNLETPSTANLRDMEFETMFNDTENAGSSSGMEFNFSFAPVASMDQGPVNESSQSVGLSNKDSINLLTINENNSFPGFENYVNTEFSMVGTPSSSKIPPAGSNANKIAASSTAQDSGTTDTKLDNVYKYPHNFVIVPENYGMGGEDIMDMDMDDLDEWLQ